MTINTHDNPILKLGDKVALIAPSSGQKESDKALLSMAAKLLTSWGLVVKHLPINDDGYGYLAADDATRLNHIHQVFHDDEIKAIFCTRGGYGLSRIINDIDISTTISHKYLIGYSDITALHLLCENHPKITCIHGPVMASPQIVGFDCLNQSDVLSNQNHLKQYLFSSNKHLRHGFGQAIQQIQLLSKHHDDGSKSIDTISILLNDEDVALTGGNLTMVASSLGTPHEIDTVGKLVLLEEVYEAPYRVDRLLMQLTNAGKFNGIRALCFGEMYECDSKNIALMDVLQTMFADAPYPVAFNIPFGHGQLNYPWRYGK